MTFVLAALVIAVLIGERLIPSKDLSRRYWQLALAVTLSLLVTALALVLFRLPSTGAPAGSFAAVQSTNVTKALRNRETFTVGAALILLLPGIFLMQQWSTVQLPIVLGGLISLLTHFFDVTSTQVPPYIYAQGGDPSKSSNILYAGVLAAGSLFLLAYGFFRWEGSGSGSQVLTAESDSAS